MSTAQKHTLREIHSETELNALYHARIRADFPSAERPSLAAMRLHIREGLQTVWVMTGEPGDEAYAACAEANGIMFITLLAVYKEKRGAGRGAALLSLLRGRYRHSRGVLLEVETPEDAADADERRLREKRIAFYARNGYRLLEGIAHESFGVPLHIMSLPLADTAESLRASAVQDIQAAYHRILPKPLWNQVISRETAPE